MYRITSASRIGGRSRLRQSTQLKVKAAPEPALNLPKGVWFTAADGTRKEADCPASGGLQRIPLLRRTLTEKRERPVAAPAATTANASTAFAVQSIPERQGGEHEEDQDHINLSWVQPVPRARLSLL